MSFIGEYILDQHGNEGQIVAVAGDTITLRSCDGEDKEATITLAQLIQLEDMSERFGVLDDDERLTCSNCQDWADHSHDIFNGSKVVAS